MPSYCGLPALDMTAARVGRGFGFGFNRLRTRMDQLHGGMDLMASRGSPIISATPGTVVGVGLDANRPGRGGLDGYGNSVIVEVRGNLPGLPNPFYVLYAHMQNPPLVSVGQRVVTGTPLGQVGNTTNGRFSGPNCRGPAGTCSMGPHLHIEVRRRGFPSSYDSDTIDPAVLWSALGIDWVGSHADAGRHTGGQLLIAQGGPSDCRAGAATSLSGFGVVYGPTQGGQAGPGEQYIAPAVLAPNYPGNTTAGTEVDPPTYASESSPSATSSGSTSSASSGGSSMLWLGAGALVILAWMKAR